MPLDLRDLRGKDPEGRQAERLLRAGVRFEPTRQQLRQLQRQEARQANARADKRADNPPSAIAPPASSSQLAVAITETRDFRRFNRDRGTEVERFEQRQLKRTEDVLDEACRRRLTERNAPLVQRTERNRAKRLKRKLRRQTSERQCEHNGSKEEESEDSAGDGGRGEGSRLGPSLPLFPHPSSQDDASPSS
jgi:hypothetical protein